MSPLPFDAIFGYGRSIGGSSRMRTLRDNRKNAVALDMAEFR